MKNRKIMVFAVIALIIIALGVSANVFGFSFSTRYYDTIIEAYNVENDDYIINEEITLVKKDNVAVALCKTTTEEYIITPFKIKNSQYFSLSDVDTLSGLEEIDGDIGESFCRIDGKKVYYNLIETENVENYKKQYQNISFSDQINANDGKTVTLVLYYK
ncbi:MAG: hypothetical protein IIX16_03745 [Clostridia bacterium]|nr:hypothetical protein [Clostridia bacterium]